MFTFRYRLTGVTLRNGARFETRSRSSTRTRFSVAGGASHYSALMHRMRRATAPNIGLFRPAVRTKCEHGSDVLSSGVARAARRIAFLTEDPYG